MVQLPDRRSFPRAFPPPITGRVRVEEIESRVLEGNPWGDPTRRSLGVYTPGSGQTEGLPLLLLLPGFFGQGWRQGFPGGFFVESEFEIFDRLVRTGACPEAVLVAVDAITALGGSQYVNSTATGRYADFVADEVVAWARERFGTGPVGLLGQSSGGFGALHLAIEHPGRFGAVGVSAGDMGFDRLFFPDILRAVRAYERAGGVEKFLAWLFEDPSRLRGPTDPTGAAILLAAMASCYSPRPAEPGSFDLPFDERSGELIPELWSRWLAFDPLVRLREPATQAALRRLARLHITASREDEWFLDLEARRFSDALTRAGVPHRHEQFDGGHFQKEPRYRSMYPSLITALRDSPK